MAKLAPMSRPRPARLLAALGLAAALGAATAAGGAEPEPPDMPDRFIAIRDDRMSVRLVGVPITEVLSELERQTGATVRGTILDPREVSAEFRAVPLPQALARLLGDENFALVYGEDGRLRTLTLLPGGQQTGARPVVAATPTTTVPQAAAVTLEELASLIDAQPPVKVDGMLAQAIGASTATYRQLLDTSLTDDNSGVRMQAIGVAIRSIESQPELRAKLVGAASGVDAEQLSMLIESAAGDRAQEFASNVTAQTRASEVRAKFASALHHLRRRGVGAGG